MSSDYEDNEKPQDGYGVITIGIDRMIIEIRLPLTKLIGHVPRSNRVYQNQRQSQDKNYFQQTIKDVE